MQFTTEELAIISKVLIRQLIAAEGSIGQLQKENQELQAKSEEGKE